MHTVQVKLPRGAHLSLARLLRGGVVWHAMATIMPHKQHHWQTFHAIAKAEGSALRSYICFQHASAVYMLPVGLGWGCCTPACHHERLHVWQAACEGLHLLN